MWVKKLKLYQFRNYEELNVDFQKGVNLIQGDNGKGKTSLVEAIGLLPLSKSLRTNDDKEMIQIEKNFARIECVIQKDVEEKIRIVISRQGKSIELNGQELKKISDLAGVVKVVSFLPKDAELFKSSPSNRRKVIDSNMSMLDKKYILELGLYNKYLERIRNLLKNENIDMVHLKVLVEELANVGVNILARRKQFIKLLNEEIKYINKYIEGDESKIEIVYKPDVDEVDEKKYCLTVLEKIEQQIKTNKQTKGLIRGVHQDDININYGGRDLAIYGSQGQNRISVIALKLSLIRLIKNKFNEEPIVILDDVLSELDEKHQKKLIQLLNRIEQVFLTGTQIDFNEKCALFNVDDNIVRRML